MTSVATDIRINLLANLAGFSGNMKQAGDEAEKATARFNKAFDSSKQVAARAEKEATAWREAMQKEGSFLASSMSFGGGETAETKNRVRWAEMLPWGKSARAEISKEAALTAAELGNAKSGLAKKLAEMSSGLAEAGRGGIGGLMSSGLGMLAAHPVGAAVAAVAGLAINHVRERENYVRETSLSARTLGASTEDVSRLHGAGASDELLSHMQRAIGEGGNAGLKKLGMDAGALEGESLQKQLEDIAEKFNKLPSAVDKATVAHELFGREGREMIPVLQNLKARLNEVADSRIVKAREAAAVQSSDRDFAAAKRTADAGMDAIYEKLGLSGGVSKNFSRGLSVGADFLFADEATKRRHQAQYNREDEAEYMADIRAKSKERADREAAFAAQEAERVKAMTDLSRSATEHVRDAIEELASPGSAARNAFQRQAATHAKRPGDMARAMAAYDEGQYQLGEAQANRRARDEGEGIRKSLLNPIDAFDEESGRLLGIANRGGMSEHDYQIALRRAGRTAEGQLGVKSPEEEYANRLADLAHARGRVSAEKLDRAARDAADQLMSAMDKPLMTAFERFDAHMRSINAAENAGVYSADEAERRRKSERDSELAHAGIQRPLEKFKDAFEEISRLHDSGTITDDEYSRRRRQLRRSAVEESQADTREVSPLAAMAAGSREAYSMLVRAVGRRKVRDRQEDRDLAGQDRKEHPSGQAAARQGARLARF